MRERYLVGNWKMNQTMGEIRQFFEKFESGCRVWLAPQAIHLERVLALSQGSVVVGAQNCSEHIQGAYTGEISPAALVDMGASFVLVGHSERRQYYGEDGRVIKKKVLAALESGLHVVFCMGENLEQWKKGMTEEVVTGQLTEVLTGFPLEKQDKLIIAYEPVWAIGTGKSASPQQAQAVHGSIRKVLSSLGLRGEDISLLYGGSVKPENIDALLSQKDIDGALVGGASLNPESFTHMGKALEGGDGL